MILTQPALKPKNPCFSSGPCAKRPGWSLAGLDDFKPGRSHRSSGPKAQLKEIIDLHKDILGIPEDYVVGIIPASDTGAFEMAMWNLLGERGVDTMAWESFSTDWMKDITDELQLEDVRTFETEYGTLPDLEQIDCDRDVVFVWNGTTSGVRVPDGEWIDDNRKGLTLCDATSAVFAYDMPWDKLDVTTWSWQKVLGSEAAHGMLVLSPRAVERLESFTPANRPLPKIFRLTKKGKLNSGIFKGLTINTPSMLAVADCLDALKWVKSIGGLEATIKRSRESFHHVANWLNHTNTFDFLCSKAEHRSKTSICLKITDAWLTDQPAEDQAAVIGRMAQLLENETVAHDIKSYKSAPPGIRIWCGATVEPSDVAAVLPWLEWAYETVKAQ